MKEAMFYENIGDKTVRCYLCPHYCKIVQGKRGFCGVRENQNGILYSLVYGKAVAVHVDPIEKKPLFHFYPKSRAFSVATVGCNLRCLNCQNAEISQVGSEKYFRIIGRDMPPEELVKGAETERCQSIAYTYTEPTIFFEYAYDTAILANKKGIKNIFVTNGYITREALETIRPYLDAANIDLKSFREDFYKKITKGSLKPVLDCIEWCFHQGIFIEITTLIIPGSNDSEEELRDIATFISKMSRDIPWHISRFHPSYKLLHLSPTPVDTIYKAIEIGKSKGLRYIYAGNVPGNEFENTFCPHCNKIVIKRFGFTSKTYLNNNNCQYCNQKLAIQV
ncbi:MAG TPA: AmmeMemoRadiSam system radical SAM enzyme [Nitrospinota bacterium]|nr:AmmeMemoRadiSam system radical SAM enzyme [Nitrospinota bacterium]